MRSHRAAYHAGTSFSWGADATLTDRDRDESLRPVITINQNGRMMEGAGGAAIFDVIVRDGRRQSMFRS
jgi:hypothetical protein